MTRRDRLRNPLGLAAAVATLALSGIGCESIPNSGQAIGSWSRPGPRQVEALTADSPELGAVPEARQHLSASRLAEAKLRLSEHLKTAPQDTAAIELLTEVALLSRDWRLHRDSLLQLAELHSDSGVILNRTGLQLMQSARLQLADRGDSPQAAVDIQRQADETARNGLQLLHQAVNRDPRNVRFAQDLAGALVDRSQHAEADAVLAAAMLRNPADQTLPITAARFYEGIGNWRRAVVCYDTALRNSPGSRLWLRNRAMCHYRQRELAKAEADFTDALRGTPVDGQLAEYIAWGDSCLNTGQVDKAQGIFDCIAREEKFRTADLELLRSVCRVQQGQLSEAAAILTRALSDWPEHRDLQEMASRLPASAAPAPAILPETAQIEPVLATSNIAL